MISHANPEDDDLAIWLATQLATQGYKVWCDKVQFLGGEQFWNDIDPVIRTHAGMVVYILSKTSNQLGLRGFVKELDLAIGTEKLLAKLYGENNPYKRFLIPVAKDDLATSDYNIHLLGRNVVAFRSWASGFLKLLEILKEADFPKSSEVSASHVARWWQSYKSSTEGMVRETRILTSNMFPIVKLPSVLFCHRVANLSDTGRVKLNAFPEPFYQEGFDLYSFANAAELRGRLGEGIVLEDLDKVGRIPVDSILAPDAPRHLRCHRHFLSAILRVAWEDYVDRDGRLATCYLSQEKKCFFLRKPEGADQLTESFVSKDAGPIRRKLVGGFGGRVNESASSMFKHYYHIGVSVNPLHHPLVFRLIQHVVFSDDGVAVWNDPRRMHRARRSFCSQWYNDRWRDSLLAFVHLLANGAPTISLPVSSDQRVEVSIDPQTYESDLHFMRRSDTDKLELDDDAMDSALSEETLSDEADEDDEAFVS